MTDKKVASGRAVRSKCSQARRSRGGILRRYVLRVWLRSLVFLAVVGVGDGAMKLGEAMGVVEYDVSVSSEPRRKLGSEGDIGAHVGDEKCIGAGRTGCIVGMLATDALVEVSTTGSCSLD